MGDVEWARVAAIGAAVLLPISWLLVCLAASGWIAEKWRLNRRAMRLTERLQGGKRKQSQAEELLARPEQVVVELR
jgi:hypothetical protein